MPLHLHHVDEAPKASLCGADAIARLDAFLTQHAIDQGTVLSCLSRRALREAPSLAGVVEKMSVVHRLYSTDGIEIDAEPIFSEADDGTWVSAWLWVPHPNDDATGQ